MAVYAAVWAYLSHTTKLRMSRPPSSRGKLQTGAFYSCYHFPSDGRIEKVVLQPRPVQMMWQHDPVKSVQDIDYFYRTQGPVATRKRVLLVHITGTLYTEYAETERGQPEFRKYSWLEMQEHLQRAKSQAREQYLSYYDADRIHPHMGLYQYGPDYLIHGGNNRLCTWKLAGKESVQIPVQEHTFDHQFHAAYQQLQALQIEVRREDEAETAPEGKWTLQLGALCVVCATRQQVLSFVEAYTRLTIRGLAWLWLRLRYAPQLQLQAGDSMFSWHPGYLDLKQNQHAQRMRSYLLAYKLQQRLLKGTH